MKKLLILALLLMTPSAFGAVAVVQRSSNSTYGAGDHLINDPPPGSSTVVCTLTSTGASHSIIVGAASSTAGYPTGVGAIFVSGVADNIGNVYTLVPGSRASDSPYHRLNSEIWNKLNATAGVTSITVTFTGAATTYMKFCFAYEISGSVTFDAAGKVDTGTCSASVCTGASVTTATSTGFVVGVISADPVDQSPVNGSEFAPGDILNFGGAAACSLISSSAAAHTPAWHNTLAAPPFPFSASTAAWKQ